MSNEITIQSYRHSYSVLFVADCAATLQSQIRPGDFLIIDRNVWKLYPSLFMCVEGFHKIFVDPSERAKSYNALIPLIDQLIENGFTRSNRLIAIGGGIVQDITAFTASILFRGVEWLFFPTNLLTQCDSCIGSKSSINFGVYKNQLGGFFAPKAVYIDLNFLSTLPKREIQSGLGEMMHYFLVSGKVDFHWAVAVLDQVLCDQDVLHQMIIRSLSIKKKMIERDEFDQGPRKIFI